MASATRLIERRTLLRAAGALGALQATGCTVLDRLVASNGSSDNDEPPVNIIEDLAHRTFRYFWETTSAKNGLAPDRWPSPSACSIAAVGFALTAYCIGVERNYVSREEARERTLVTLRFLRDLPQGPRPKGTSGYRGFFYHFIAMDTGLRDGDCELSTVDTALLLCGALHAQAFFDGEHADEVRIRRLVDELATRVDWRWAQTRPPTISLGWKPESGFLPYDWRGYNEAAVVYLLAMGHPDTAGRPHRLDRMDQGLSGQLVDLSRAAGPELPAAVRPPVLQRLGRLPRPARCVLAPAQHRLRREQPSRGACAARLRDAQSEGLARLRRRHLGLHGV